MSDIVLRDDDLDAFFAAPSAAYGRHSLYVSPLRGDIERSLDVTRNPLFGPSGTGVRRVITAHRAGAVVGRIVALVHGASNLRHHERRGSFGYFDCVDDTAVAQALLGQAEAFARQQDCTRVEGNFNLTAMQQCGVLTSGFDAPPYSDMHYNPPHIPLLLDACGYRRRFAMSTFELDMRHVEPASLLRGPAAERARDPELEWTRLTTRDFTRVLDDIRIVLNDGFARNPMFVPLSRDEMQFQMADLSHVVDARITALVRDAIGPVGVVLCIPDLNPLFRSMGSRRTWTAPWHLLRFRLGRRRRAVIVFYAVAERRQGQGLNGAMLYRVITALRAAGYERLGVTWISDVNAASLRQVERIGARLLHRLHLYGKNLS